MRIYLVILLQLFLLNSLKAQEGGDTTARNIKLPKGYTRQLNVVYSEVNGWEGKMDMYLPAFKNKPSPVIICIHGGGWNHGTKESEGGFNTYFKMGFAVVSVEYRLINVAPAPAAITDCRCALIYLINHAKELHIDVSKIVAMGGSAGGHLALMLGMLGNDHRFDSNCTTNTPIQIAAIIDKFGVADLAHIPTNKSVRIWLGDSVKNTRFVNSVSPIQYVTRQSPPTFIAHGDMDHTVPYQQSVELHQKLVDAGVKTRLITVQGAGHGKFTHEQSAYVDNEIVAFLKEIHLTDN